MTKYKHLMVSLIILWNIICLASNYIFILDWTPGFNWLGKDNCKARRETFKVWEFEFTYIRRLVVYMKQDAFNNKKWFTVPAYGIELGSFLTDKSACTKHFEFYGVICIVYKGFISYLNHAEYFIMSEQNSIKINNITIKSLCAILNPVTKHCILTH